MKKEFYKILTVLLTLTVLFAMLSVTVYAESAGNDGSNFIEQMGKAMSDEFSARALKICNIIVAILIAMALVSTLIIVRRRKNKKASEQNKSEPMPTPSDAVHSDETEEPVAEEPAEEEPVEEPIAEEPIAEEPAAEEPAEEPIVEEPAEEKEKPIPVIIPLPIDKNDSESDDSDDGIQVAVIDGLSVPVRYRSSYMSRLIQAGSPIQDYYTVIKNTLLSYKGVKSRMSWNFESFNSGRTSCAKLTVKGKNLSVYLALDPSEYSVTKYHFTDVSDKPKLDKVPMLLKVKSDRGLRYAVELIVEMMSKLGIEKGETQNVDYRMPYETTEALAERGLVKAIYPKGVNPDEVAGTVRQNIADVIGSSGEEKKVVIVHDAIPEVPIFVDAKEADEILSNEFAIEHIEHVSKAETEDGAESEGGKFAEINVDTLCENFENGETVTLKALKEKHLVSKNAGRLKVLARGTMTKTLTVYADRFSIQAVKMITLAGGHADLYD